jgi:hypothetical protein
MLSLTAYLRMAPRAAMPMAAPMVTLPYVPRFWIFMQVVVLICLIASMVIAIIKL